MVNTQTLEQTGERIVINEAMLPPESVARVGEVAIYTQRRNEWLETQIDSDPARPLPKVELIPVISERINLSFDDGTKMPDRTPPPSNVKCVNYEINDIDGRRIGAVKMRETPHDELNNGNHYIGDIKIIDEKQGEGYGLSTYLAILKALPAGHDLRTEGVVSTKARKVWQKLIEVGVAKRIGREDTYPHMYETVF